MTPRLDPRDEREVLARAVSAWRSHSAEPPPARRDELDEDLPYLPLDVQVPVFEAIRWLGYERFREAASP